MPLELSGDIAGLGKIVQIVRATDTTQRTTTSTSYVDANISVTITPQKSDSAILVLGLFFWEASHPGTTAAGQIQLTDNSNNTLSGAEGCQVGVFGSSNSGTQFIEGEITLIGYSTPATTSATTYKARFKAFSPSTLSLRNNINTGQLFAIEVAA